MQKNYIEERLKEFEDKKLEFDIYIVADVVNKTIKESNYEYQHANESEFFSRKEFAEIASAIFDVFGFVKVFYSEIEFINYILEKHIKKNDCIIFNFCRDGTFQGKKALIPSFCDLLNFRYTGSNAFTISLLREKYIYSCLLKSHSIPIPKTYKYNIDKGFVYESPAFNEKLIVKQVNESASIGMDNENIFTYINNETSNKIINLCKKLNTNEVLVQEYIDGIECEVCVIEQNNRFYALDPIAIIIENDLIINSKISNNYDYRFKLLENIKDIEICSKIRIIAEKTAQLLNIKNYARFDFRINKNNNFFLIDIAGTPYTIKHSSIAFLFTEVYKLKYADIYKVIINSLI